ncbi:MAG: CDP-alcohol phosphatidyltransferase family protein [Candidatus Eremiobacterota bacterium]
MPRLPSFLSPDRPSPWHFYFVTGCTSANLLVGMLALFAVMKGFPGMAAWCLLACVVLDALDGALAKYWNVATPFGAQLDSLADMTSFIVAGAVLAYSWLSPHMALPLVCAGSGLYVLTGAIRLARFNVTAPGPYFTGVPTTVVTMVLSGTYLTAPQLPTAWGLALVVLLSVLMVSVFPYPKRGQLKRVPVLVWLTAAGAATVDLNLTLWLGALAYILSGPIIWLVRKRSARSG